MECCRERCSSAKPAAGGLTEPRSTAAPASVWLSEMASTASQRESASCTGATSTSPRALSASIAKVRPEASKQSGGLTKPIVQRAYRPGNSYEDSNMQPRSESSRETRASISARWSPSGVTLESTVMPPPVT